MGAPLTHRSTSSWLKTLHPCFVLIASCLDHRLLFFSFSSHVLLGFVLVFCWPPASAPRDLYIFPSSPPLGSFVCVKIKRLFAIARTRICTTKQQFILSCPKK